MRGFCYRYDLSDWCFPHRKFRKKCLPDISLVLVSVLIVILSVFRSEAVEISGNRTSGQIEFEIDSSVVPQNLRVLPRHSNFTRSSEIGRTSEDFLEKIGLKASLLEDDGKPHDKTFFGEDSDGNPVVVGTWLQYGSYTLAVAMFGTAFMVACAATAVYYVIFVVTDIRQSRSMGRSADSSSVNNRNNSTLRKIFQSVDLALDVYEKLDLSHPQCQQKIVCEIQESKVFEKTMFRRLLHNLINVKFWSQPSKISKLDDLRQADRIGLDTEKQCAEAFACPFSLDEFHNKFKTL